MADWTADRPNSPTAESAGFQRNVRIPGAGLGGAGPDCTLVSAASRGGCCERLQRNCQARWSRLAQNTSRPSRLRVTPWPLAVSQQVRPDSSLVQAARPKVTVRP